MAFDNLFRGTWSLATARYQKPNNIAELGASRCGESIALMEVSPAYHSDIIAWSEAAAENG